MATVSKQRVPVVVLGTMILVGARCGYCRKGVIICDRSEFPKVQPKCLLCAREFPPAKILQKNGQQYYDPKRRWTKEDQQEWRRSQIKVIMSPDGDIVEIKITEALIRERPRGGIATSRRRRKRRSFSAIYEEAVREGIKGGVA